MARTLYLVCYDISLPSRLNRVRKYLSAYRVAGQKSVFECWMTSGELRRVMQDLETMIDPAEDRVHILQLDPRQRVRCFGTATHYEGQAFMIV